MKRSDDSVTKGSVFDARKIFLSYLHSDCRLIKCSYNHSDEEEEYARGSEPVRVGVRHCAEGVSELLPERSRAAIKRRWAFGQ